MVGVAVAVVAVYGAPPRADARHGVGVRVRAGVRVGVRVRVRPRSPACARESSRCRSVERSWPSTLTV